MQVIKENKAFDSPREKTMTFFSRGDLYFPRDVHLSFVCGASDPIREEAPKFRRRFLDWAQANEPKLVCVRAENAVTDLLRQVDERHAANDLGVIENVIAETVDSLLIFPESPGSFAELGLFSANEAICEKMLVALLVEHQGDSFITLGPVKHISVKSSYPNPIILSEPYDAVFRQIADRLLGEMKTKRSYRRRYSLKQWREYTKREKLAILDCIFDLIGICTEEDLFDLILKRFGSYEVSELRLLTALLAALGRISLTDDADIVRLSSAWPLSFIEGAADETTELRARWNDAYRVHLPEAIEEVSRRNQ